jgi:hypothetical protein
MSPVNGLQGPAAMVPSTCRCGELMSVKLGEADRRAVDLVLDKQLPEKGSLGQSAGQFVKPMQTTPERVNSVEKILALLQELPTIEPSKDLVSKTLNRVDKALAGLGSGHGDHAVPIDRPVA